MKYQGIGVVKYMKKEAQFIKSNEWTYRKKWNQYNSYKLLAHVERWKRIIRGKVIPAPALITVDPSNVCDLNCAWCNAGYIRQYHHRMLSEKTLNDLADFLPRWGRNSEYMPGVQAVCVAGGGEPLLNHATPGFIERLAQNRIEIGVVTNGTHIDNCLKALSCCTWVGVSVDAGTERTFNKLKGLPEGAKIFSKIMKNISALVDCSHLHNSQLGKPHPSYGVSYKYLIYKDNVQEIYEAAKLAKSLGCTSIHFRPAGTTWNNLGTGKEINFTTEEIEIFKEQISRAQELDDDSFGVFGITHKFNDALGIDNCFEKCYAVFMTAVVEPPQDEESMDDAFTLGLCCDRRGDTKLELLHDSLDVEEIEKVWGSERHWQIFDEIDVQAQCPRCTYQPHNQIYQSVIMDDSMTYKFI